MPELPEVETIRRGLEKYLVGKKILGVKILDPKLLTGQKVDRVGSAVVAVRRFGKGLVIDLDNKQSLAVHIKMTGQLFYQDDKTNKSLKLPSKFTRAIFLLNGNARLYFNDIRRFGWLKILKTKEINELPFFKGLGPEPLKDLTIDYFKKLLAKSNGPVKTLLMDQKKIGGVGNIYANDALNLARINPQKKTSLLKKSEIEKLFAAVLEVLQRGLKFGGASEINYLNVDGRKGNYQKHFLVYGRAGEKCFNCGGMIKKIKLGGRGTYFCPDCQH